MLQKFFSRISSLTFKNHNDQDAVEARVRREKVQEALRDMNDTVDSDDDDGEVVMVSIFHTCSPIHLCFRCSIRRSSLETQILISRKLSPVSRRFLLIHLLV